MDPVAQYEIPFLHPLLVHFPLVLLLLGAAAAGLYLVLGRAVWRRAGLALFALGALSAWAAAETGPDLRRAVEGDPVVEEVVQRHQDGAAWTVWTSALAALAFALVSLARVRIRLPRRRKSDETGGPAEAAEPAAASKREPLWGRLLVLAPSWAAAAAVAWTAHLGGVMVWGVPR